MTPKHCLHCGNVIEDEWAGYLPRRYCSVKCEYVALDEPPETYKRDEDEYAHNGVNRKDFS